MPEHRKPATLADRDRPVASVNLAIRGFSDQSQVPVETIVRWLEALPNFHLAGLDAVIFDPKRRLDPTLADLPLLATPTHKGQFVKADRQVLIHDFATADELQHILYHEIGHHVFERVLSTTQRHHWVLELSRRTSARITRYARRNALEDFAESYAVFVTDPGRVENLHRKYTFLREEVFGGVARNIDKGFLDISV